VNYIDREREREAPAQRKWLAWKKANIAWKTKPIAAALTTLNLVDKKQKTPF